MSDKEKKQNSAVLFKEILKEIDKGGLMEGLLSSPNPKGLSPLDPIKIKIRPIMIKNVLFYQLTEQIEKKAVHRNIKPQECKHLVEEAFSGRFRQGVFSTQSFHYHALVNRKGEVSLVKKEVKVTVDPLAMLHNRKKNYLLPEGEPIAFLVSLGIMSGTGQVIAKKYDKFRQINRFVEMVNDVVEHLPKNPLEPIQIIDFGCGKAYLTFALYHYLHNILGRNVQIQGLDLKQDVIDHCANLAESLGYKGLSFKVGDIKDFKPLGSVDMVISLHACDTATDAALEKALSWEAKIILCVPCCQHELYNQIKSAPLASLLRHGILKERFASLVTDALRAELLTYKGYEVQVLEFIDMEHTPKNILIRAVKQKALESSASKQGLDRYQAFKEALHINPALENLLFLNKT